MKLISSILICTVTFNVCTNAQDIHAKDSLLKDTRAKDTLTKQVHVKDSLAKARRADSVRKAIIVDVLLKNPNLRPAMVSTTFVSRGELKWNYKGRNLLNGDFGQRRTEAQVNLPVVNFHNNGLVTANVTYVNMNYRLSDIKGVDVDDTSLSKNTLGLTTTYHRSDSLFGRTFISSASVVLLTGDGGGINKYAVMLNGMFLLKATAQTTFMLGAQVIIDPTSNLPVVPLMIYQKRLPNGFDVNITIPQQLTLRKKVNKNCWASFGTSLVSTVVFSNITSPGVPKYSNLNTLDLKTGPSVEYKLNKLLLVGVSAGLWTPMVYRQYGRWEKVSNYIFDGKAQSTPFMNVNLSIIPF